MKMSRLLATGAVLSILVFLWVLGSKPADAQKWGGLPLPTVMYVEDEVGLCWAHFFRGREWLEVEPIECTPRVRSYLDKYGSPLR